MIKVFDAFSGIGSLTRALENLNLEYEIVAKSEIDIDAVISYGAMRDMIEDDYEYPPRDEMKKYLYDRNIGLDVKSGECKIEYVANERLKACYQVSRKTNNMGDISRIDPEKVPDFDLMNFSFPCTDISAAGKRKGMGEGTESGLYRHGMDIIYVKRPRVVIIENVKNLVTKRFIGSFYQMTEALKEWGYSVYYPIDDKGQPTSINSIDHGVPQSRERVFVVCILNPGEGFVFPEKRDRTLTLSEILDEEVDDKYFLKDFAIKRDINKVRDGKVGQLPPKGVVCSTASLDQWEHRRVEAWAVEYSRTLIASNHMLVAYPREAEDRDAYCPHSHIRRFTPNERFKLMGFTYWDAEKCRKYGISDTQLTMQSGNSIVVNVLEDILKNVYKSIYGNIGRNSNDRKKTLPGLETFRL